MFGKIRPYFHKVGVSPVNAVCSSDIIVLRPITKDWTSIVLGCTSSVEFIEKATATSHGTKMPRANWDVMAKYPILVPSQQIMNQFNDCYESIVSKLINMIFQNRNLYNTRDLLLPKLISGEIDVSELDISVPEEVLS